MNKKILLLLPALAMILVGCNKKPTNSSTPTSSEDAPVGVESVTVSPDKLELETEQSAILTATVKPITLLDKDVTWSSDNPTVASVNTSGKVVANTTGTATITATANADSTKKGTCEVTVKQAEFKVAATPVLEKDFRFGAFQANLAKRLFFKGTFEDYPRGETSDNYADAVKVRFEEAEGEGKYYVSFTVSATTKYLSMGDNHRFGSSATKTAECVWDWNSEYCTITRTLSDNKTYFPGTYASWTTISGCDIAQVENDFIFQFLTPAIATLNGDKVAFIGATMQLSLVLPDDVTETPVWSLTPADEKVTISQEGLVTVTNSAVAETEYTAHVVVGEDINLEHKFTIKAINYGTLEEPLTVTEAKAVIDLKAPTLQPLFIKGTVKKNTEFDDSNNWWQQVWLDGDKDATGFEGFKLRDPSTDSEWSHVFEAANSLLDLDVVITGIGSKYNDTYETDGNAGCQLVKVPEYQHSSTLAINPSENFELTQGCGKTIKATFEAGKKDGVNWSVTPLDGAAAGKVTVNIHGKVVAADDAVAGAQYRITAQLFSDHSVEKTLVVTVKLPGNLAAPITFDFASVKGTGGYVVIDDVIAAAGADVEHVGSASSSYVYAGNGTGGAYPEQDGFLKFSSSKQNGYLIIKLDSKVNKVVITAHDWKSDGSTAESSIKVNNGATQKPVSGAAGTNTDLTFSIAEASNSIRIDCTKRAFIFKIVVSYVAA